MKKPNYTLSKGISRKINEIARPEFELAYYDVAFQHIHH